jgi:hypothetical protein
MDELLPVPYYHVVFTLPEAINRLAMYKPKEVYDLLFATAWSTIESFAQDPKHLGARTGMITILHTWGQTLTLHPHLHCIVPGGGISKAGYWKCTRSNGKFLFPVKAMSKVFRARYMAGLRKHFPQEPKSFFDDLFRTEWVVFAKRPFGGPEQVIEYLGRYTHKIAISNHRITDCGDERVTFTYKDYRQQGSKKQMTLPATEFIRRFSLHILPKRFVRIRHYGILSSRVKTTALPLMRQQLNIASPASNAGHNQTKEGNSASRGWQCPCCKKGTMIMIAQFDYRGPPPHLLSQINKRKNK